MGRPRSARQQRKAERELEVLLVAQRLQGQSEGRTAAIAAIIQTAAAGIIAQQYAQISSTVLSGGLVAGAEALRKALQGSWSLVWKAALTGPIEALFNEAEIQTDQGKYRPPFDTNRPGFAEFLDNYVEDLSQKLNATTGDAISEVLEEAKQGGWSVDKTAGRIREVAPETSRQRARTISRTELLRASRSAAHFKAERSGVVAGRRWRDSNDNRVREEHEKLDGEYAAMGEPFSNGQMVVGETDVNCRCTAEFVIDAAILGGETAANAVE